MEHLQTYIILFGIIVAVGQVFSKSVIPTALLLVITGMIFGLCQAYQPLTWIPR